MPHKCCPNLSKAKPERSERSSVCAMEEMKTLQHRPPCEGACVCVCVEVSERESMCVYRQTEFLRWRNHVRREVSVILREKNTEKETDRSC